MKKTRKLWLGGMIVAMVVAATCGIVAGCGKAKGKLTLDAGIGGTLSEAEYKVEVGANLKDFLADKTPVPESGLTFAGWYVNGAPIADGATMSKDGITLTAKYNAAYTLNVYTQGLDGNYPETAETTTGTAIYLEPLDLTSSVNIPEGFAIDSDAENVLTSEALGKDAVFTIHLERNLYPVLLYANIDGEANEQRDTQTIRYGNKVELAGDEVFELPDARRLAGWAEERNGEIVHHAGDELTVEGEIVLYAVWDIGYADLYGGDDVIYFSGEDDTVAYLVRGGMEFEGVRDGDAFTFEPDEGALLEGKIIGQYFAYTRSALEGTYTFYSGYLSDEDDPLVESETLVLDGTMGATYTHVEEGETVVDKGIYYPGDSRGEYVLELEGEENAYIFILSESNGTPVFSFYDVAAGDYAYGTIVSVEGYFSLDEDTLLSLDGVGGAAILDYVDYVGYYGKYDIVGYYGGEVPVIHAVIEGYGTIDCILVPLESGETIFVEKDPYAGTYTTTADGKDVTIELSGYSALIGATIKEGTAETYGAYWVRESEVFGTLLDIYDENGEKLKYTYQIVDEDGELSLKPFADGNFVEYMQLEVNQSGKPGLYYPTILFYDELYKAAETETNIPAGAMRAEVYYPVEDSVTGESTLVHAASGYYTVKVLGAELNYYTITQTSVDEHYTGTTLFRTISCLTGSVLTTSGGSLDVYYIFEADDEEVYILISEETEKENGGYLWYREVGITDMGSLYFAPDGTVYEGSLDIVDMNETTMYMDFEYFDSADRDYYHIYFVVHENADDPDNPFYTYVIAEDAPHTYEYSDQYGGSGDGETLFVDGAGFAIYTDAEGNEIVGTYEETGTTVFGDTIYTFTATTTDGEADPESFDFILYYNYVDLGIFGTYEEAYFYLYDEGLNGTLTGEGGIELELDGFYYWAEYTDADGVTYSGNYFLLDEDYICFMDMEVTGDEFYFIVDGKTITLDGESGGSSQFDYYYEVVDDSYLPVKDMEGYYVIFDEDSGVTLYDADDAEVGTGTWTLTDEDDIYDVVLTMGEGETEVEIKWNVQLIADDDYMKYLCVLYNEDMKGNFVGPNFTVLYMDGWGYGSYYDEMGFYYDIYTTVVNDTYMIITDYNGDFEYFVSYNVAARTFKPVDNSAYYASFYTTDLFGSVVFADGLYLDGELYGYYIVKEGADKATVFAEDEVTGAYTEEEFVLPEAADKTYELDGVTYYRWNEGEAITLKGTAYFHGGEIELAVTLTFTPDGTAALNAPASITYKDGETPVTVDGFELVIEMDYDTEELMLTLYDANRVDYPVYDLTWNPDNETGNTFIVIGTFLYTELYEDFMGDYNGIYYGHFALGDIAVSKDQYWIVLEATDLKGEELGCFVDDLDTLKTETINKYYGTMYETKIEGTDENTYVLTFFLITEDEQPWTGSGTPYLLIYAVTLDQYIDGTDGVQNLVLYTSTCVYVNAFSNVLKVGKTNVGLYLRLNSDTIGYLEPDDTVFADDGSWIIWDVPHDKEETPDEVETISWLLELTYDEETGLVTDFTATQGAYGYFYDSTRQYIVGFFYTLSDDDEYIVPVVYALGTPSGLFDAIITDNKDGTWTIETEDATYTVTISLSKESLSITVTKQAEPAPAPGTGGTEAGGEETGDAGAQG